MKVNVVVILLIMSSVSLRLQAQQKTPPPQTIYVPQTIYQGPLITYKYHDGVALLQNGATLKGRFQRSGRSSFTYRASSQAPRQKIGASMIRRLALAGADTLVTDRADSTIFIRFGNRLYRQLTGGATTVMDRHLMVDEDRGKVGGYLYVLDENDDLHKFTSLKRLNNWFYNFQEQSGKRVSDAFLNENEIVKAVAQLNKK